MMKNNKKESFLKRIIRFMKGKPKDGLTMEELAKEYLEVYLEQNNMNIQSEDDCITIKIELQGLPEEYFEAFFMNYGLELSKLEEFKKLLIKEIDAKSLPKSTVKHIEKDKLLTLVEQFLDDYALKYQISWKDLQDAEALLESIEELEDYECEKFFTENNISMSQFLEFSKLAKDSARRRVLNVRVDSKKDLTEKEHISSQDNLNKDLLYPSKENEILNMMKAEIEAVLSDETTLDHEQKKLKVLERLNIHYNFSAEELSYLEKVVEIQFNERLQNWTNNREFYQKILDAFQTLHYDYMEEEEKKHLAQSILEGKVLKYQDLVHLNLSMAEYNKIKNYIVTELNKNSKKDTKEDISIVLDYYLNQIFKDYTCYEKICLELNAEKIRREQPKFSKFTDYDLKGVIELIKKEGKIIALAALVKLPEIPWDNFEKSLEQCQSLGHLQKLSKEMKEAVSKANLSDFNKNIILHHMNELLEIKKKSLGHSKEIEKLITEIKKQTKDADLDGLVKFYQQICKPSAKKELKCENMTDEEYSKVLKIIKDIVIDEISDKILADLKNDFREECLEKVVKKWDDKNFKKYQIPEELKKSIQNKIKSKLKNNKTDEQQNILKLGTKVSLNNEVVSCENINDFTNDVKSKETLKKGKKGKITGYVVQKGNSQKEITDMDELKQALQNDYKLVGYNLSYRNLFRKKHTFVKKEDVEPKDSIFKRIWKKIKKHKIKSIIIGLVALGVASGIIGNKFTNDFYENKETVEDEKDELDEPVFGETLEPETEPTEDNTVEPVVEESEALKEFESIPSVDATVNTFENLDGEKIIYKTINDIGTDNKSTAYYRSDSEKIVDGICLESPEGVRKVYQNTDEIIDLMTNYGYKYIGTRIVNEHSYDQNGNVKSYEGFYGAESINLQDVEESLARRRTL